MLSKWQHRLLCALGGATLLLVIVNALVFKLNRDAQGTLAQRQQFIQQTVPLEGLYRDIVKSLAEMAFKGNDKQLLDMLTAQGLTFTPGNAAPAPATNASRPGAK